MQERLVALIGWGFVLVFSACDAIDQDVFDGVPQTIAPVNGAVIPTSEHIVLEWEPVRGAALYRVQVSQSESFGDLVALEEIKETQLELSNLQRGTYFWRVFAVSEDEVVGLPSEVSSFQVEEVIVITAVVPFDYEISTGPLPAAAAVDIGSSGTLDVGAILDEQGLLLDDLLVARIRDVDLLLFEAPFLDLSLVVDSFAVLLTGAGGSSVPAVALSAQTLSGTTEWVYRDVESGDFAHFAREAVLGSVLRVFPPRVLPGGDYVFGVDLTLELLVPE